MTHTKAIARIFVAKSLSRMFSVSLFFLAYVYAPVWAQALKLNM